MGSRQSSPDSSAQNRPDALKLQPQRLRGELDQRHHRSARGREIPHECRSADLLIAERNRRHEVLPLDVLDERVLRIVAAGRPGQAVPFQFQLMVHLRPTLPLLHDCRADFGQGAVVRVPHAPRREAILRLQMQVEDGRMRILAAAMRETDSDVSLEGTLVGGETGVPVESVRIS